MTTQPIARRRVVHLTRKDFIRQTFRTGGKGGQRRDKTETGVRFIHEPSGARGESSEASYQHQNEKIAFRRMAESPKMRMWIMAQHQAFEQGGHEIEIRGLTDAEILTEVRDPETGEWVTWER